MPGKLRVEYPGAIYHVMSRGDWCENMFLDVDGGVIVIRRIGNRKDVYD
jgi:hypothetical protein